MKKLIDYEKEINRCSKCGLCQSVCPVYKITGNDCSVSRGKFIMLRGILKGELELNKNINKYMDTCLKCNACKDFCPSNIDAREIFLAAKSQYFKKNSASKFIAAFQSEKIFNSFLNLVKIAAVTYRSLKVSAFVEKFYPIFLNFGWLGRKVILANEFAKENKTSEEKSKLSMPDCSALKSNLKVIYFKGCVNEYVNPKVKNSAETVLKKMGVKVLNTNFECCGLPFTSSGNLEQFKKQAEYNLSQINEDFDYFLTDCASCQDAFKEYEKYIEAPELLEKLSRINSKSINISEFIMKSVESISFTTKKTVTFHKPCHLDSMDFFYNILDHSTNIEYREMEDFDKCCGFSGEFAIKNPALSEAISAQKAKNAVNTGADYILTTCPACTLGITQGLIKNMDKSVKMPKVLNLVEFIAMADSVKIKPEIPVSNKKLKETALV